LIRGQEEKHQGIAISSLGRITIRRKEGDGSERGKKNGEGGEKPFNMEEEVEGDGKNKILKLTTSGGEKTRNKKKDL